MGKAGGQMTKKGVSLSCDRSFRRELFSVVLGGHHGPDHDPEQPSNEVPVARARGQDPDVVAHDEEQPDDEQDEKDGAEPGRAVPDTLWDRSGVALVDLASVFGRRGPSRGSRLLLRGGAFV